MQRVVLCACLASICVAIFAISGSTTSEQGATAGDTSDNPVSQQDGSARTRSVRFTYGATFHDLNPGNRIRVWIPVPKSDPHQTVQLVEASLPVEGSIATENRYGNRIMHFESTVPETGQIGFVVRYDIERSEIVSDKASTDSVPKEQIELFLSENRMVPNDGKQLELLEGLSLDGSPMALARSLYDRVDEHVRYDKSQPGYGNGDVAWVCDSKTGNCTDFHSLFISLARSQQMPARFEIGFPLPPTRGSGFVGGYHCWAMFHTDDEGWTPVDISEADKHPELKEYYFGNLTENRIAFSVGRDIVLEPKQAGPPLNYFVYPYAEAEGTPIAKDNIKLRFTYKDQ